LLTNNTRGIALSCFTATGIASRYQFKQRIGALEKRVAQAGTASGVNTGSEHAMAQAVHGTAPEIAPERGRGGVTPDALSEWI
jgi:hypothetical protein